MKKAITVLLIFVLCITFLSGCKMITPSKKTIKLDIMDDYFGVDENGKSGNFKYRNFKLEKINLANKEDGEYFAEVEMSWEWYDQLRTFEWVDENGTFEVVYKHYDKGGWVLKDVDCTHY